MFSVRKLAVVGLGLVAMGGSYLCAQDDPAVPQEEELSVAAAAAAAAGQPQASIPEPEDSGWRISPEKINIQMGQDRILQALDDEAQELKGGTWAVNNPDLAGSAKRMDTSYCIRKPWARSL